MHAMAVFLILLILCLVFAFGRVLRTIIGMILVAALVLGAIILWSEGYKIMIRSH